MGDTETTIGGGKHDFPSTCWTLIRQAKGTDREPLEKLVSLYWKPAYFYIRAAGRRSVEDAKDLVQDFFTRLLERKDWEKLDPARGSFRGFLKRALKNFMIDASRRDEARRPRRGAVLFRFEECRDLLLEAGASPDDVFDREWIQELLRTAIRDLETRLTNEGAPQVYEVFRLYCLGGGGETTRFIKGAPSPDEAPTYAEVGAKLGLRETDVRKRLARCRTLLREIVMERIREYSEDDADMRAEYERIVQG
jgi:RNA polymerase sigma-70 factor (ECF subfamily)